MCSIGWEEYFLLCFFESSFEIEPSPKYDSNAEHQRKTRTCEKQFLTSHITRAAQVYHLMVVVMELKKNGANISMEKAGLLGYVALHWLILRPVGL